MKFSHANRQTAVIAILAIAIVSAGIILMNDADNVMLQQQAAGLSGQVASLQNSLAQASSSAIAVPSTVPASEGDGTLLSPVGESVAPLDFCASSSDALREQRLTELKKRLGADTLANTTEPVYPDLQNDRALLPSCRWFLYSLANHAGTGSALVYETADDFRVIFLDSKTHLGYVVAASKMIAGGNAGGVFFPVGITKNDRQLVMRAIMGSPGAGGGSVDYGYALLPIAPMNGKDFYLWDGAPDNIPTIATSAAVFYDDFSQVLYATSGSKTPQCDQPCSSNNAKVVWRNVLTGAEKTFLEEPNTSYAPRSVDEQAGTVTLDIVQYTSFPTGCTDTYCAEQKASTITEKLP